MNIYDNIIIKIEIIITINLQGKISGIINPIPNDIPNAPILHLGGFNILSPFTSFAFILHTTQKQSR